MGQCTLVRFERSATIDRGVFWLHYRVTFLSLCFLALVIASRQHFGTPIECAAKPTPLNNYCWSYRTFTVDRLAQTSRKSFYSRQQENRRFTKGYQHYYLLLLVQACGFYLPRLVWCGLEGKLMQQLLRSATSPNLHPEERAKNNGQLVQYFQDHMRRNTFYLFFYMLSELLCIVNNLVQLILVNHFLDGVFNQFPGEVFRLVLSGSEDRTDPLSQTFLRTTLCQYGKSGGAAEPLDVSCALPHNPFNELACVGVWYGLAALCLLTVGTFLWHTWELLSPRMRLFALKRQARLLDRACLEKVLLDAGLGDWFLFLLFCGNADPAQVSGVFGALAKDLGRNPLDNILVCYPTEQVVDKVQRTASMTRQYQTS